MIVCADFSTLIEELPEIEIGGLSNQASLEVLLAYIRDNIARIPQAMDDLRSNPDRKFFSGGSSSDPVPAFRKRIVAKVLPVFKELANREPGSDFELSLLLNTSIETGTLMSKDWELQQFRLRRLLGNHVHRLEAQKPIMSLISGSKSLFRFTCAGFTESSPPEETKAIAWLWSVNFYRNGVVNACRASANQKIFDERLAGLRKHLKLAEEFSDVIEPKLEKQRRDMLRNVKRRLESQLNPPANRRSIPISSDQRIFKSRMEKVIEVLKSFLNDED